MRSECIPLMIHAQQKLLSSSQTGRLMPAAGTTLTTRERKLTGGSGRLQGMTQTSEARAVQTRAMTTAPHLVGAGAP